VWLILLLGRSLSEEHAKAKEPDLFLTIKVVTDETFSHHQGFDLTVLDKKNPPLSDPPAFQVSKQTTCSAFKSTVAKRFNYHESRIRFRVLVHRQNKTVRPDSCIPENEPSPSMPHEFCVGYF